MCKPDPRKLSNTTNMKGIDLTLIEIVSIRFNERGKSYFFDPAGITVAKGEKVVVETAKGLEYGECVQGNHQVNNDVIVQPLRPVIRIATEADNRSAQAGKEKEKEAFDYCKQKIGEFGLEMKLISVEYGFEGNKVLFFFTSDGRVDFRELVKELAGKFRARIELRQIGVRDEAKMLGGLGVCGKQFCCSQFLNEFHPVSIKMAKVQGLSLNPAKISGSCGRLMCCLKYEEVAYEELVRKAPKIGAFVETPSGKGSVISVNLLRQNAKVRLEDGHDTTLKTFIFDELDILGGKGRRAEYIIARDEGRLEEAGFLPSPPPTLVGSNEASGTSTRGAGVFAGNKPSGKSYNQNNHNRMDNNQSNQKRRNKSSYNRGDISGSTAATSTSPPHPQPLNGAKKKKPHHKRRRGRGST